MKLLVGLGNPGSDYVKTRHNAGYMAIERLCQRHGLGTLDQAREKFFGLLREGEIAGQRCLLLEPITFMNRSGQSVSAAMTFYKLPTPDLMVVVDDVALPVGRIRLRGEGSTGGHNGLADIQAALGTAKYNRLRVGVDAPGRVPQRDYVLGRFAPDQLEPLDLALNQACDAIECWLRDGLGKAMSLYNAE